MKLTALLEIAAAGSIATSSIAGNPFMAHSSVKRRPGLSKPPKVRKLKLSESNIATFDVKTAILFEYDGAVPSMTSDKNSKIVADTNDKVSNAVKRAETDDKFDTSTFGLQDADGKIIKVTVKRDQANDFESRLNSLLSDTENPKEIAEVLYLLKQDYDIVDVEWDEPITEDEAPVPEADGDEEETLPADGEGDGETDVEDMDLDLEDEEGDEAGMGETPPADAADLQSGTVDLLQQVINLLKAETEARTANAKVATADAESKMTNVEHQKQEKEISSQQEIADMEEFEEAEKEKKKNERLIARVAKFRSAKQQAGV